MKIELRAEISCYLRNQYASSCVHIFMQLVSHKILSLSKEYNFGESLHALPIYFTAQKILLINHFMAFETILVLYAN